MRLIGKHTQSLIARRSPILFIVLVLVFVAATVPVYAAPKVQMRRSTLLFRQASGTGKLVVKTEKASKAVMQIVDSQGRVAAVKRYTLKAGQYRTMTWDGRSDKYNKQGLASGHYVRSGSYKVTLSLKDATGKRIITRTFTVRSPLSSRWYDVTVPSSMTPATQAGTTALRAKARLTRNNDAFLRIIDRSTGKTIAFKFYPGRSARSLSSYTWDGRVTQREAVKDSEGEWIAHGEPVPAGTYTLKLIVKGSTVTRTLKVKTNPKIVVTPPTSSSSGIYKGPLKAVGFAIANWVPQGQSKTLSGTVKSDTNIQWVKVAILNAAGKTEISKLARTSGTSVSIKEAIDRDVKFATLTPGKKTIQLRARDASGSHTIYSQTFYIIGATRLQNFWSQRVSTWSYPLNRKRSGSTSAFGTYRDGGKRAHAAIDLLEPAGTAVYAMTSGHVQRISTTYFAGTGAVEVKNDDGTVANYCEIKPLTGLKKGDRVEQNERIGTIITNTTSARSSMLHLEMYAGTATGSLSQSNPSTYDNVTPVNYQRRRDLVSPMGVLELNVPEER